MQQRITFFTIGVSDLEAMKNFYREKFGWETMKDSDGIVFFKMNGFIFGLYPKHELAEDIGVKDDPEKNGAGSKGFKQFAMAINLNSEKEVDDLFVEFKKKGVKIIKAPEKVFWGGYRGYVSDIENNYWEFAFNPFLKLDKDGNVIEHK
ncbi:MAG TPA: VOC family protein [Bacteroidia bacterium]|jgi:predicted enzyme related to lactoylglutathione lyase|nr:VOC family protein [Bacteroidia bacterium]